MEVFVILQGEHRKYCGVFASLEAAVESLESTYNVGVSTRETKIHHSWKSDDQSVPKFLILRTEVRHTRVKSLE